MKGSEKKMARPPKAEGERNLRLIVSLPPDLDKRMREYAEANERPLSWIIQKALAEWLDKHA